jgi:hypothetical protein
MPDRPLKLRELRAALRRFAVEEDPARGKGSHTTFFKNIDGELVSYPVPTSKKDVRQCYVSGCRRRFKLTPADGISDRDFYGK